MTLVLRPYQEQGVAWLTDDHPHKLLADDMGLGKTPQGIAALNRLGARTGVVVCPATVKIMWARRIAQWGDSLGNVFIVRDGKAKIPVSAEVIIINYDLLIKPAINKQLVARGKNQGYDFALFDEARALKEMSTKRTKASLGRHSFVHFAKRIWLFDGTPVPNRPVELFPLLSVLAPEVIHPYTSFQAFGEYFCNGKRNVFGWNMSGHSNTEELSERLINSGFFLRRTKEQVMDDLPDKVESVIELDVEPPTDVSDTHIATVRRDLAMAKLPQATRFIRDMVLSSGKVVAFAHHRDVIEGLADGLSNEGAVIVYGGMSAEQKQKSIDAFVADANCQVLIGQTIAGGTGVDGLQEVCNRIVFVELDWSPGVMDQAIDRCRRIGQTQSAVFVYYLAVPNSLDTVMDGVLEKKRNVIKQLMRVKESIKMSIDNLLERGVVALEKIASALGNGASLPISTEPASAPSSEKSTKSSSKKAKSQEPDPEIKELPEAAPEPQALDFDAVQAVMSDFVFNMGGDREANKNIIRNVLLPQFNVTAFKDLSEKDYPKFAELLKAGPEAYALPATANGLDV